MKLLFLILAFSVSIFLSCKAKEGEACVSHGDCKGDMTCFSDECVEGEYETFRITCLLCSFNYSLRWRSTLYDDWTEISSSDGYGCTSNSGSSSTCYSFIYPVGDIEKTAENACFDIEAQNGFGTWSEVSCFSCPEISGDGPYEILCF
jgi:hypothetical protein